MTTLRMLKPVKIPAYIVEKYGSARRFKETKRRQLIALEKALDALRIGCAFLPTRATRVDAIAAEVESLRQELSVKEWGR